MNVRSKSDLPILADFTSGHGTPLVVNRATGRGYVLLDDGTIAPLNNRWVDVADYASFEAAVTAIGSTVTTLLIGTSQSVTSNVTVPSTLTLFFVGSGQLSVASTKTVTINGPIVTDIRQIFAGSGTIAGLGKVPVLYPDFWGTNTTPGTTDMTAAIQAAVDVREAAGFGEVYFLPQVYLTSSTITVAGHRIRLIGKGRHATKILYNPSGAGTAIKFYIDDNTDIVQCGLEDIGVVSSDTTYQKVAIQLRKVTEFTLHNVAVGSGGYGSFTGAGSIGLQIQGHDVSDVERLTINADQPISIEDNPNNTFDLDAWAFRTIYLLSKSDHTYPNISIATGINVTNVVFDGLYMIYGSDGVQWIDTTSTARSASILFRNVRWEQSTNASGYIFDLESNFGMNHVTLENVVSGANLAAYNGFKFRKVRYLTIINSEYSNTLDAFDIDDASSTNARLINVAFPHATGKLPNTYTAADTTPSVLGSDYLVLTNGGAVTITDLDVILENGKVVTLIFTDGNTTIQDGSNFQLSGGANFTGSANDTLTLRYYDGVWYEMCRSVN